MIKNSLFKKFFSATSIFTVLLNLMLPLLTGQLTYAQEVTPEPVQIQEISTPVPDPTVAPVEVAPSSPSPSEAPVVSEAPVSVVPSDSPVPLVSPSPDPTPPATIIPDLTPAITPEVSPLPLENGVDPVSSATPSPTPAPIWQNIDGGGSETSHAVVINEEYIYPGNDRVSIKFTQLSDAPGKLSIKEVKLTADQVKQTGALSDTAYEITSTMADGTFFYDLTLPIPPEAQNKEIDVKSSETIEDAGTAQKVSEPEEKTADTITIHGLNHFTVFIITTPSPDNTQPILINEVLPNPSVGAEWIELYNNSLAAIDLAAGTGWTIDSATGAPQNLSALGTISAGGLAVFEAPAGWLSNTAPETVTVSNETGTAIDTVTISLTSPGFAVNRYPGVGESVGRSSDGNAQWILFTSPTKGTTNVLAAPSAKAVATTIEANGYPTWYGDDNGVRVAQDPTLPALSSGSFPNEFFYWSAEALLNGSRLTMAAEAAFNPDIVAEGNQITFGRLRIDLAGLSPNSTYTITHPYGVEVLQTDDRGEARNDNDDIGCAGAPCDFAAALASPVFQSFLSWDSGAPAGYLGDGITEHAVTGSPTGNNFFRIEGPGLPDGGIQTSSFIVLGKIFTDPVTPPPGCIDTAPDVPALASPSDGASGVAVSPTLSWNTITNFGTNCLGNTNQFEIFLDSGSVNPTTSFGSVSEATLSKLVIGLASNTTFSWKVRAKNGALFTESAVQTFTTTAAVGSRVVSPNFDADNSYPTWYRDDNGIMIVPCLDGTDPRCVLPGAGEEPEIWNPALPTDFPDAPGDTAFNFPSEFFYWIAESDFLTTDPDDLDGDGNNGKAGIRFAVEGAFLNELPAPGDQMVFGRIRVTANELQPNSTYTVTHPYGVDTYQTNDLGIVTRGEGTEDIGCVASLCDFSLALPSRVFGSFLRHNNAPEGYLGDAISLNPVVGAPTGNNFFRIEGPGLPEGGLETPLFTVSGKVLLAPPPPPQGCVDIAPDQPQLVSPANAATEVSTNPLVTWNALGSFGTNCLGGRNQFEIFLDEGVVADPITSRGTVLGTQTGFTVLNLLPNTSYSWKVRASNTALNTDSVVRTFTTTASTANKAVSPLPNDPNGFPNWYRDDLGASVVPCIDGADPICVLPAAGEEPGFDPAQPSNLLAGNFPSEFFYWIAESNPLATPGGGDVDIRYAVEGAFLGGAPVPGDQMVFGRIRVRATGLLPSQNQAYTVTHAYGVDVYSTDENGNITSVLGTEDVGCQVGPCNFVEALSSRVFGGFLRSVTGAPVGYLGDGATFGAVTGSPLNQNFFRIEGPGLPAGGLQTDLFTVSGKLLEAVPPGPDVTAPTLTSFSSTTADGIYGPGAEINITANFSEPLAAGSTAIVNLDNTVPIELVQLSLASTTLVGTYTVGPLGSGQDSPDLTVAAITFMNATDAASNLQTSTVLPASNIADTSDIVINTTTVIPPPATTGTITVIKDAVPDDVQDFAFRIRNGAFDQNFSLDDDGNNVNELSNNILFADLAPGVYDLQEDGVGNWVLTELTCVDPDSGTTVDLNARSASVDLDSGENITCTFTNSLRNSISGMKFRDLNGNGIKEAGEAGLLGWTIFLDENDNAILDGGETSVVTDGNGLYQFIDVPGGTNIVREVLQDGWLQTAPVGGKYTLAVANNSFINQNFGNVIVTEILGGTFAIAGDDENSTSQAVALEDVTVETPTNGGITSIIIPAGTVISRTDGSDFDPNLLVAADADEGLLSGFAAGVVADGALQFGLPASGLTFSQPITINFFVGDSFNGQTLNIQRSVSGTTGWTSEGIVAPTTCTVADGFCSFQATLASIYAATHTEESAPTPTPAPAPASAGGGGGGGGGDGRSDGLGCASHDCSIHPSPSPSASQGQASGTSGGLEQGVLGIQTGDFGTGTGGPIIEGSPSPSPEALGDEVGNVGIGGVNQAGGANQSFLAFMQTQGSLLGILVVLVVLFCSNILYGRRVSQR